MTDISSPRPFDERAALQELERLAEKIQATRRQRQEAVAEFESFVKTFRDDRYNEMVAKDAARPPAPAPERRLPAPLPPAPRVAEPVPVPPAPNSVLDDVQPIVASAAVAEAPAARRQPAVSLLNTPHGRLAAAAGIVAFAAIMIWLWSGFGSGDAAGPETPPAAAPTSSGETPAPAASPKPVASTGPVDAARSNPARALNVELITSRPVWTRVIVDGQKVIERELPKDSRIPLGADRAIAIRAGDAGAIRLTVGGKDVGVLGRDGQIGTRTLTAPPAPPR